MGSPKCFFLWWNHPIWRLYFKVYSILTHHSLSQLSLLYTNPGGVTDSVPECGASNTDDESPSQGRAGCVCMCTSACVLDCTTLVGHSFCRRRLFSYIFMRRLSFPAPFPSTPSPPSRPRPNKALESGIRAVSLTAIAKAPLSSKTFSVFTNI